MTTGAQAGKAHISKDGRTAVVSDPGDEKFTWWMSEHTQRAR